MVLFSFYSPTTTAWRLLQLIHDFPTRNRQATNLKLKIRKKSLDIYLEGRNSRGMDYMLELQLCMGHMQLDRESN